MHSLTCYYPLEASVLVNGNVHSTVTFPFLVALSLSAERVVYRPPPGPAARHHLPIISVQKEMGSFLSSASCRDEIDQAFLFAPQWAMRSPTDEEIEEEKRQEAEDPYWERQYQVAVHRKRREERSARKRSHGPMFNRRTHVATPPRTPPPAPQPVPTPPPPAPILTRPRLKNVVHAKPISTPPSSHVEPYCRTERNQPTVIMSPEYKDPNQHPVEVQEETLNVPPFSSPIIVLHAVESPARVFTSSLFSLGRGFEVDWEASQFLQLDSASSDDELGVDHMLLQNVTPRENIPHFDVVFTAKDYETFRCGDSYVWQSPQWNRGIETTIRGPSLVEKIDITKRAQPRLLHAENQLTRNCCVIV
jgi:hypothetical protein